VHPRRLRRPLAGLADLRPRPDQRPHALPRGRPRRGARPGGRRRAAEAERHRRRTELLDLAPEDAVWILYARAEKRSEQKVRPAVHVLRGLTATEFTDSCLYLLPYAREAGMRGSALSRLSGWAFAGADYHCRSWFLTRKGEWHRSGAPVDSDLV
jgi:hypothetical protein